MRTKMTTPLKKGKTALISAFSQKWMICFQDNSDLKKSPRYLSGMYYQMDHIWWAPSSLKKSLALICILGEMSNNFRTIHKKDPVFVTFFWRPTGHNPLIVVREKQNSGAESKMRSQKLRRMMLASSCRWMETYMQAGILSKMIQILSTLMENF